MGGSRAGPVVTPHTLELTARGRVTLLQAPPDTARAYLPPEYRPGRVYSDTDSEKVSWRLDDWYDSGFIECVKLDELFTEVIDTGKRSFVLMIFEDEAYYLMLVVCDWCWLNGE